MLPNYLWFPEIQHLISGGDVEPFQGSFVCFAFMVFPGILPGLNVEPVGVLLFL